MDDPSLPLDQLQEHKESQEQLPQIVEDADNVNEVAAASAISNNSDNNKEDEENEQDQIRKDDIPPEDDDDIDGSDILNNPQQLPLLSSSLSHSSDAPLRRIASPSYIPSASTPLFYELGWICFSRSISSADQMPEQFDFSQSAQSTLDFLSNAFNETFIPLNDSMSNLAVNTSNPITLMNEKRTRLLKAVSITINDNANNENDINNNNSHLSIQIFRILESLQGQSCEILKYIDIAAYRSYACNQNHQRRLFVIEINLGVYNLHNILRLKRESAFDARTMKIFFQSILAIVLQIHARGQYIGCLSMHNLFILPETFLLVDYIATSSLSSDISIIQEQQVNDLYELGKALLSIEFVNEGFDFEAIKLACLENSPALAKLANKHNCNRHLLKTSKFVEIDAAGVLIFEVENIVEAMLSKSPTMSSMKIAMLCQKIDMLMRHNVLGEDYSNIVVNDNQNDRLAFKGIEEQLSEDAQVIIVKKQGKKVFEGSFIGSGNDRRFNGKCTVNVFNGYTFIGNFVQGEPYGEAVLKKGDDIVEKEQIFNFIFKHWLNAPKVIQSVTIEGMLQINRSGQQSSNDSSEVQPEEQWVDQQIQKRKLRTVCRDNVIVCGDSGQEVIRLSSSYQIDGNMLAKIVSMVGQLSLVNMNHMSSGTSVDLQLLQSVKYFCMKVDSDVKARFVVSYLQSETSAALETLDLSHSTKLEYDNYRINATLSAAKHLTAINTIVLNNCISTAPQHFVSLLIASQMFKKIHSLYLEYTCVDPQIFTKIYESPNVYNLRVLSLNESIGLSDASLVQFAERMPKFKGLRVLNLRGLLKRSFNKSIFSDSNISAMKKVAGQMHFLTVLSVIIFDDCYINDSVLEIIGKASLPCLLRIQLRRQQKITSKGLSALLSTNSLPCLQTINCNSCLSLTLPKAPFSSATDIDLALFNCKSLVPSNISDYLRGNSRASGIRFEAKLISVDVIASINSSRTIKTIEILCCDQSDVLRFFEMLRALDRGQRKSPLASIHICFHMSRSYIDVTSEEDILEQRSFKITQPTKPDDHPDKLIELFRAQINTSYQSNTIKESVLDRLFVHRHPFKQFLSIQENIHKADQSSFFSAPQKSNERSSSLYNSVPSNNSSETLQTLGFIASERQRVIDTILPETKKEILKPKDGTEEEGGNNSNTNASSITEQSLVPKMQFIEDLRTFIESSELSRSTVSLDLSKFCIGSDEISLLTFAGHLQSLRNLNLSKSMLRSADLVALALKARSLQSLQTIDLTLASVPIFPGFMALLQSTAVPNIKEIRLSFDKLKHLVKHITQSYRRVTVPLSIIENFSKFKSENKVKISVENSSNYRKYLATLDFYINKKDHRSKIKKQKNFQSEIKAMMNEYTIFYFRKHHRHAQQVQTLLRLMRFQRISDDRHASQKYSSKQSQIPSESESSADPRKLLRLTVIGHEYSGKKSVVEKFLESNFFSPDHLRSLQTPDPINSIDKISLPLRKLDDSLNLGIKSYHTELYRDAFAPPPPAAAGTVDSNPKQSQQNTNLKKKKIELEIRVIHSHEYYHLLRLCQMRDSDGIAILYDTARDDQDAIYQTQNAFTAAQLFRSSKPVFVGVNRIPSSESNNRVAKIETPSYFIEKPINLNDPVSIRNFFEDLAYISLDMKKRKSVLDSNWLTDLSDVLQQCDLNESELMFDFLRVRNEINYEAMKEFCEKVSSSIETLNRFNLSIYNWGNHGQVTEDALNRLGNTKKLRVRITDSLSFSKHP